jgi:hypothetical protein
LFFEADAGQTFYLAVDGEQAADVGDFTLDVICGPPPEVEVCGNGLDDDADGLIDCADPNCESAEVCDPAEDCSNQMDDDGDGAIDCGDGDCATAPTCISEVCEDAIDNDGDGLVDCDDPECVAKPSCLGVEDCFGGFDEDGDGAIDCDDLDCAGLFGCPAPECGTPIVLSCDTPMSSTTIGATSEISQYSCFNSTGLGGDRTFEFVAPSGGSYGVVLDASNGADLALYRLGPAGPIDCSPGNCQMAAATSADPETLYFPASAGDTVLLAVDSATVADEDDFTIEVQCTTTSVEVCGNGLDDDGDGLFDCDDPNCEMAPSCVDPEDCLDGLDNDLDGLIDCADPECALNASCRVEDCEDGTDNDYDGATDCDDLDCLGDPACELELCGDGVDNDVDGQVDCADPDCGPALVCGGDGFEDCDNGLDDNSDGAVDCADPTCATDGACAAEDCGTNLDEDGDLLVGCDDPDCVATSGCVTGVCPTATVLNCGDVVLGSLAGPSDADYYGCGFIAPGPEQGWEISTVPATTVSITLDHDSDVDFDLVMTPDDVSGCTLSECMGYSATSQNPETLGLPLGGNSIAFIFVEAASIYDTGEYILTVECGAPTVEVCDNLADDDGDFIMDCVDSDCASDPSCLPVEDCSSGLDEDADGAIDCGDPDCASVCNP